MGEMSINTSRGFLVELQSPLRSPFFLFRCEGGGAAAVCDGLVVTGTVTQLGFPESARHVRPVRSEGGFTPGGWL